MDKGKAEGREGKAEGVRVRVGMQERRKRKKGKKEKAGESFVCVC